MTSVPSGSKGKGKVPSDWRIRALATIPTPDDLADLRLPIKAFPEQKDTVPAEYAVNTLYWFETTLGDAVGEFDYI